MEDALNVNQFHLTIETTRKHDDEDQKDRVERGIPLYV